MHKQRIEINNQKNHLILLRGGTAGYIIAMPSAIDDGDWMHPLGKHLDSAEKEAPSYSLVEVSLQ